MSEIYLVRHGLIDCETLNLNEKGTRFATELVDLLKDKEISFISSSSEIRCIETVTPIAKHLGLQIKTYDKFDFKNLRPLQDAILHNNSKTLICYRVEEINFILDALKQAVFDGQTRNSGYEKIIHLTLENGNAKSNPDILTGHKKKCSE
jgi:hypothetical protein